MNIDVANKVAEAYLQSAGASEAARLEFLKGLWEIQASVENVEETYTAPDPDRARDTVVSGEPLFHAFPPEVAASEYLDTVSKIATYTSENAGLPDEQSAALQDADFASALEDELVRSAPQGPTAFATEVARRMGADPDGDLTPATVTFVLLSALVPYLAGPSRSAFDALGEFDSHPWPSGICPVCGEAAALGRMGESTQLQGAVRTLWCGSCHAEWGYERVRCVRCGTRNPDKLRYTYVEDDPAHRVHLCDECHGYAKFVFEDELKKPLSMVVEDAITMTLDAVALAQGYSATGDGGASSC